MSTHAPGPRADDCVSTHHTHVGICQRAGYANGLKDASASQSTSAETAQTTRAPDYNNLPVGTPVLAFYDTREGRALVTRTRSLPWIVGGSIVVKVEGAAGGIALSHIEVLPVTTRPEEQQS